MVQRSTEETPGTISRRAGRCEPSGRNRRVTEDRMSYQIVDDVLARPLGDAVVLFQPETERLLTLNESGSRIWELLSEKATTAEITARLCEAYSAPEHVIQQEIQEFLLRLESERLIRRAE